MGLPEGLQLFGQVRIGSSGTSWHQLPRKAGVLGSPSSVNTNRPVAGQWKFQSSRSSSMICMALAWVMGIPSPQSRPSLRALARMTERIHGFSRQAPFSVGLTFRNHTPHPALGLRAVALPAWDQMPVRMQHRLPGGLA